VIGRQLRQTNIIWQQRRSRMLRLTMNKLQHASVTANGHKVIFLRSAWKFAVTGATKGVLPLCPSYFGKIQNFA